MSEIILAYAILSLLPIGFIACMVRSIGLRGAAYVLLLCALALGAGFAFSWALSVVVVRA